MTGGLYSFGDGEQASTAVSMFPLLNKKLVSTKLGSDFSLSLSFAEGDELTIIPDANGMESYVVNTKRGIVPVMLI